jgi:hypothetical protein
MIADLAGAVQRRAAYSSQAFTDFDSFPASPTVIDMENNELALEVALSWEDDIGEPNPIAGTQEWAITAIGQRPIDHAGRDLLFGSLFRDPRPKGFHWYVRKPKGWMSDLVNHFPSLQDQQHALQMVVLQFLHRRKLCDLLPEARLSAESGSLDEYNLLRRLWRCWPFGAQVEWQERGDRSERDVCGLAWLCPWCFARKVTALYELLGQCVKPARTTMRYLLLAKTQMFSPPPDPSWVRSLVQHHGVRSSGSWPWWMVDLGNHSHTNFRRQLRQAEVKMSCDRREELRQWAKDQGVDGGLVTYQVGPDLYSDNNHDYSCFRQESALLGEVAPAKGETEDEFEARLLEPSRHGTIMDVQTALLPMNAPSALRCFLLGSSLSYPTDGLDLKLTDNRAWKSKFVRGIPGAFALQPHFMFDDVQWWSHAHTTKNMRLYQPFGTWVNALSKARQHRVVQFSEDCSPAAQALHDANDKRRSISQRRRQELVEVIRPHWKLVRQNAEHPRDGRPSLRGPVRELLHTMGEQPSDRDLRFIVKELSSQSESQHALAVA